MKKLLALLLALLMLAPSALAMGRDPHELNIPCEHSPTGSITLTWYPGDYGGISTADTWVLGLYLEEKWEEAYALNLLLAEEGDAGAMVRLGGHHLRGIVVPQDCSQALAWYQRAWKAGDPFGLEAVALMYLNGWGVEADAAYAAGLLDGLAEQGDVSPLVMAELYLLGCGNLAPDMEKAMQWFDVTYAHEYYLAQGEGEGTSFYRNAYERKREAFLSTQTLPASLTTAPMIWGTAQPYASDAMDMGVFWSDGTGGAVNHQEAARWFALAIEMDSNSSFVSEWSHYALGEYYRNGTLGVFDMDKAIRHYTYGVYYDEVAEMFLGGVTGPDGTVYLAPDAALAEAFAAVDEYRNSTLAHYSLLGDLFRTGIGTDGKALVTPDPYLAGLLYFYGDDDPHCAAQLTEMYRAGLITDPMLLYRIARDIPWSECDVSELILLLADDLIHGRVTTWLADTQISAGYTCVDLGADLLESALEKGKLPDPQAAYDLLALIPSDE